MSRSGIRFLAQAKENTAKDLSVSFSLVLDPDRPSRRMQDCQLPCFARVASKECGLPDHFRAVQSIVIGA